ncbi:MAG: AMIN domain-containing protein, partial [Desulfuromonas sp.]|nr:AMIN domain-containing protein [Desulfuromonas sp.]
MTLIMSVRKTMSQIVRHAVLILSLFLAINAVDCSVVFAGMTTVEDVVISDSSVVLKTDTSNIDYEYYTLGAPPRLVVDVKQALPEFEERSFKLSSGFSKLRVGMYADETRFVFDAASEQLPVAGVVQDGKNIVVDWSKKDAGAVVAPRAAKPASVETIDFDTKDGVSLFTVTFDSRIDLIRPIFKDDTIIFGAKNTAIPRSLRRVVDASVFPSAVLQITPYSTIVDGVRNVMFSAKMKGPVEYSVNQAGNSIVFRCVDGPFEEPAPTKLGSVYVPVETSGSGQQQGEVDSVEQVLDSLAMASVSADAGASEDIEKIYTGEPVSLVLDDADIRKVMQLIAEISDLNIILSDDVKGNISLRLHDVPWDQALDLILEIKELGTISEGNVVRVLPKKTIHTMEENELKAKQAIVQLEETRTEIFDINYKDTETIADVIDDILSDQGEVQAIDGSKKIMVNDIPAKLDEVRALLVELDEPVKQVMIEARIVEMRKTEGLDLGINWGLNYTNDKGVNTDGDDVSIGTENVNDAGLGLGGAFMLPSSIGTSGLGALINFGRIGLDSTVINLRISALEASGMAKVVSSPKILTLDGESARIEQGTSIPY